MMNKNKSIIAEMILLCSVLIAVVLILCTYQISKSIEGVKQDVTINVVRELIENNILDDIGLEL